MAPQTVAAQTVGAETVGETDQPAVLASGFAPDPRSITGRTAGERPMNELHPGCRGYVDGRPSAVLELESELPFLRLFVISQSAVTLAVRRSDGQWRCGGAPLHGAPREEGSFGPGRIELWVGSGERGREVEWDLRLTEFQSVTPESRSARTGLSRRGEALALATARRSGLHGDHQLQRGFLPDPRRSEGLAGGTVDLRRLGGECSGFVNAEPNHVVQLTDEFDYLRIQVGNTDREVSLLMRSSRGEWFCEVRTAAALERERWLPGIYRIWVGASERGDETPYSLCLTEARAGALGSSCGE